jgi:putative DNA methylase
MNYRKKLIEVSMPLKIINDSTKPETENPFLRGHPRSIHNWWARTPLSACRAILFCQIVDDPSEYLTDENSVIEERERLFSLIENLVKWENINNEDVLDRARLEIARCVARSLGEPMPVGKYAIRDYLATKAPPIIDPFAGRGSIPLEAQRLGLRVFASDLNPVAVLINKALIEIPSQFANMPPVHPRYNKNNQTSFAEKEWSNTEGLCDDIRFYSYWMLEKANERIGGIFPTVVITNDLLRDNPDIKDEGLADGDELRVIAWLWTRTVKCPNPACGTYMPLIRSYLLSSNKRRISWVEPIIDKSNQPFNIRFRIKVGKGKIPEKTVSRGGATCIACGTSVGLNYVREEGRQNRLFRKLIAIVVDGKKGKIYLPPIDNQAEIAERVKANWRPDGDLPRKHRNFQTPAYGMGNIGNLFTERQLVALDIYSQLVIEARKQVFLDATRSSIPDPEAYADAIAVYLACSVSRLTDYVNSLCTWNPTNENIGHLFQRQAIPMVWDFAESNPLDGKLTIVTAANWVADSLINIPSRPKPMNILQWDAQVSNYPINTNPIVSTDPPYYDNIAYANLSDFFYVWLRRSLKDIKPDLFTTLLTPKSKELIVSPKSKNETEEESKKNFQKGFEKVFSNLQNIANLGYPITVYYAFKQEEEVLDGRVSTGWETMLEGLISSGFQITGTWPIRTTKKARSVARDANALASAIVIACLPQRNDASTATRRDFVIALRNELPLSLHHLQQGFIAPVDLAQASIGPGMAIFSRYKQVLEADGSPMSLRTALSLINQALDEFLIEQEGEYDADTRWALTWFEQMGFDDGEYGVAETLSKAKDTSVAGMVDAGILKSGRGKVRLLKSAELPEDWDPTKEKRLTVWEMVHHLVRALESGGESMAATYLAQLGSQAETARELCYRLYTICERKKRSAEALSYNALVQSWPEISRLAREISQRGPTQTTLF